MMPSKKRRPTPSRKEKRNPSGVVLIQGGWAILEDEVARVDLRVENGRIVAIGTRLAANGARVIDARGKIVMPGLVQAHTQVCHTLFRGAGRGFDALAAMRERVWPLEGALGVEDLRAAVRLGIAELLLGGTTTILDMGSVRHAEVAFEEALRLGIRYVGGKSIMDHGQGFPANLRESADDAMAESLELCSTWHGADDGRLRYAFSPSMVMCCSDNLLERAAEAARERGVLIHTHTAESGDEVTVVRDRTGHAPVEHLHALGVTGSTTVLAHVIWVSMVERRMLQERRTKVVHCPSANLQLGSGVARIPDLLRDGLLVGLGAASAAYSDSLDGFAEMRIAALIHNARGGLHVSGKTAFSMATHRGAEILGLEDVGTLAVGKQADVVILATQRPHMHPLADDIINRVVFAGCAADVEMVMVDGKVLVEGGELLTSKIGPIIREANARAAEVVARVD